MAGVGYISVSTSTALQATHRLNRRSSFCVKLNGRAIRLRRCISPPLANPYAFEALNIDEFNGRLMKGVE